MKKSSKKSRRNVSERDMLIEQCMKDAYCERMGITPDQLDEGWWDDMRANVSGAWAGAKRGLSNMGTRIGNVGRAARNVAGNVGKGIKMAGNVISGNKEALKKNYQGLKAPGADNKEIAVTAADEKNNAAAISYAKSLRDSVDKFQKIASKTKIFSNYKGAQQKVMDFINLLDWMKMDHTDDKKYISPEERAAAQPTTSTAQPTAPTEREEELNDSYDPTHNTKGQRLMLESIR